MSFPSLTLFGPPPPRPLTPRLLFVPVGYLQGIYQTIFLRQSMTDFFRALCYLPIMLALLKEDALSTRPTHLLVRMAHTSCKCLLGSFCTKDVQEYLSSYLLHYVTLYILPCCFLSCSSFSTHNFLFPSAAFYLTIP